jgi:hypothetical protein
MIALYPVNRQITIAAMVTLMPQGLDSHGTASRPSAVSAEFTSPKVSEKTEPNTIAIATIEVTFGRKNATR